VGEPRRRTVWRLGVLTAVILGLIVGFLLTILPMPWDRPVRTDSGLAAIANTAPDSAASNDSIVALQPPVAAPRPAPAVGLPVSVTLTRLGISSALQPLRLEADGSLQSPSKYQEAGWYSEGVRPGAVGPAVIAGHVDSYAGPAVFYRLPSVHLGDDVEVLDSLGVTRHFIVSDVEKYPKDKFPSEAVYGPAALPTVRLITCYGAFDQKARSYVDNLVVSAVLKN
jgi:hypothetical protein